MTLTKTSFARSRLPSRHSFSRPAWWIAASFLILHGNPAAGMAPRRAAASAGFQFSTHSYIHYSPAFLGNGYLSISTPWNGTGLSEAAVDGLYDHLMEGSYAYRPLIPAWNEVDFWDGLHWLNSAPPSRFQSKDYVQQLDAYRGLLTTAYEWSDGGRSTGMHAVVFVCRDNPHLGVVRVQITPHFGVEAGPVTVSFPIGGPAATYLWEGAELPGSLPIRKAMFDKDHRGFEVESTTRDGKHPVVESVRVKFPANLPEPYVSVDFSSDLRKPALNVKFIARKNQTYDFTKFVTVAASPEIADPAQKAEKIASAAERSGYDSVLESHERAWARLWQSDIQIEGDKDAQRAVHAAMFYLFSALRRGAHWSVPAMALPSRAYLGRVWWDADTFVLPAVLPFHPSLAQSIVAYRCRLLPGARLNAARRGYRGALFPMESAGTGEGAAPEWGSEIHITGDVAMAQWRYFEATGSLHWLRACGYPVIHDVAEFWSSRVSPDPKNGRYDIRHVTGPNEAIVDVDNDSYTNAVARRTLEVALKAAHLLHQSPDPRWAEIAPKILVPFDEQRQYHPEHSGDNEGRYAHALILLTYPLNLQFSDSVKRNDLNACLVNFGKPGYQVGMLGNFYSIVASELGDRELATRLLLSTIHSYAQPPFYAMTETPENGRAVFLTAEGAFLQQIIFGFAGLRFTPKGLAPVYKPILPAAWKSLELRDVVIRGKRSDVHVEKGGKLFVTPAAHD